MIPWENLSQVWLRLPKFLTNIDRLITIFQAPREENCDFLGEAITNQQ